FRVRNHDDRRTGLLSFDVSVSKPGDDSTPPRELLVSAEVVLVKDVVVARRPINQGQVINGRDLMLEERSFDKLDGVGLQDMNAAIGLESRRFVKQGEMLDAKAIQARPLVRRGDLVKILVKGGGVEIRTTGQAQAAGALGDVIAVRRDGSRRKQELIDVTV